MRHYKGNPSKLSYICIVWFSPKMAGIFQKSPLFEAKAEVPIGRAHLETLLARWPSFYAPKSVPHMAYGSKKTNVQHPSNKHFGRHLRRVVCFPKKTKSGAKTKSWIIFVWHQEFSLKKWQKRDPHRWIHSRVIKGFVCVWCLLKIEHDKSLFDNNLASYLGYLEAVGMVWNHLGGWKQYPEIGIPTIVIFCSPKFLPRKDGHLLDVTIVQPERIAMSYSPSKNINSVLMV